MYKMFESLFFEIERVAAKEKFYIIIGRDRMYVMLYGGIILLVIIIAILVSKLCKYRSQIRHIGKELSMLNREDTNYRLSSYCHIGKTEEIIILFNDILEGYRKEMVRLKRENGAYRESITSISHDIRTPLTSAKGYLQMLVSDAVSEDKRHGYIVIVEQRVNDVTNMLNQLFEYARVEAGEMEFASEHLNITNLFIDTISMFYDDFLEKDCEPVIEVVDTPLYIKGDRSAVVRIIENLIKNALVHGIDEYCFSLKKQGNRVILSFSNKTDSIEEKDVERIFDRFYTTDISRTRKTTGLGLAIVKEFVHRMGGEVCAELQEDIFIVRVEFPCEERES